MKGQVMNRMYRRHMVCIDQRRQLSYMCLQGIECMMLHQSRNMTRQDNLNKLVYQLPGKKFQLDICENKVRHHLYHQFRQHKVLCTDQ
jgi:hypothetical protein